MGRAAARSELLRIWSRGLVLDRERGDVLQRFVARYGFLMMVDNESPAQRYRRLAEECLEVAYTFPDGERRTVLVQMAQVWRD